MCKHETTDKEIIIPTCEDAKTGRVYRSPGIKTHLSLNGQYT